ncbi:MAG: MFS transporter [Pseudomonadota bacterium]|nr:MFS transporter [Pseudomonadota bacterium]
MAITVESRKGRAALMVMHCAGMVDLVALSMWVGTLIAAYGFDAQQAGGLPTLFLSGVVVSSLALAPRIQRLPGRWVASVGFGIAALAFFGAAHTAVYMQLALLHAVAGIAAGAALSVTHGTIARSANPHRLFALVGIALGFFAVVFLGGVPQLIAAQGGAILFRIFAAVMALGAVAALLAFPSPQLASADATPHMALPPLPRIVWFGMAGIACMTLVQAMIFSFLEGVGAFRGFERGAINGVLIALGLVNLLPAALAALLEKRISARSVMLAGPVAQVVLASIIMLSPAFGPYAVAGALFAAVMIFTHTFVFGFLAHLDGSGRTLAATPAMLMIGSALGPFLGGTLVEAFGYGALAGIAVLLGAAAVFCFSRLPATASVPAKAALA